MHAIFASLLISNAWRSDQWRRSDIQAIGYIREKAQRRSVVWNSQTTREFS